MKVEVKLLRERIDERMQFCVAEISIVSQEERIKQCSKCKGDSEMKKYILTDKGRARTQRPSIFYGTLWPNLTDGSSFMSPDEGEKSPEFIIQSKIGTPKIDTFF